MQLGSWASTPQTKPALSNNIHTAAHEHTVAHIDRVSSRDYPVSMGPLLVKIGKREGLTAFSESFLGGMTRLTFNGANGGETLWGLQGTEVRRRKAR